MKRNDEIVDWVRALVRRRGRPADPTADTVVAEVRTNDEIPLRPPDPSLDYVLGAFIVEWAFGVPYGEAETFHQFLRDSEKFIADACRATMPGVSYLGTYWSVGLGQGYRTYWAYATLEAEHQWTAALASPQLSEVVRQLRSYWARDPHRSEQHLQPAALFSDLDRSALDNPFVALSLAAARRTES